MRPLTARVVYSMCLCTLTAWAVLPAPTVPFGHAPKASAPQPSGIAVELATTMRRHAETALAYGPVHPEVEKVTVAEASLRDTGAMADPKEFEYDLIQALTYELANARRDHTTMAVHYGDFHPEALKASAVVSALTTAINAEVRRARLAI